MIIRLALAAIIIYLQQSSYAWHLQPPILPAPINFDQTRIDLTRTYQDNHYGIKTNSIEIVPIMIVLHWTDTSNFTEAYLTFNATTLDHSRPELNGELNVSAHFLIDRDGSIYQLMPDNWMARHVIGLNHCAIGIENIGGRHNQPNLTLAQAKANAFLVNYLKQKYPTIVYLIGHSEYQAFKKDILWQEQDSHYISYKNDPGKLFLEYVRRSL